MAVKYYCDGCDRVVAYDLVNNASVKVEIRGLTQRFCEDIELCKSCVDRLIEQANPKTWVRDASHGK